MIPPYNQPEQSHSSDLPHKKKMIKKIIRRIIRKKPTEGESLEEVVEEVVEEEQKPVTTEATAFGYSETALHKEDETQVFLNKMQDLRREIRSRMEAISEKIQIPYDEITEYLEDPKNFSPGQWEQVQKEKDQLAEKAWAIVGVENQKRRSYKEKKQKTKELRGKTIGARKKNWIPIR